MLYYVTLKENKHEIEGDETNYEREKKGQKRNQNIT